ncbi:hypothetical protein BH09SUM1_BH09SUM1_12460 [soil metagenome]
MHLLKKLAFVFLILVVSVVIGVIVVGEMLKPPLPSASVASGGQPMPSHFTRSLATVHADSPVSRTLAIAWGEAVPAEICFGRVTDQGTGAPIVGASVVIAPEFTFLANVKDESFLLGSTVTDSAGNYRLEVPPGNAYFTGPNPITVQAMAKGYSPAPATFAIAPRNRNMDFALVTAAPFVGRVQDSEGAPIAGAFIARMIEYPKTPDERKTLESQPLIWARSDAPGAFELPGVGHPPTPFLIARATGFMPRRFRDLDLQGSPPSLTLERTATSLEVTFIGDDEKPIVGAFIDVGPQNKDMETLSNMFGESGKTDAEGKCLSEQIAAGDYHIQASVPPGYRVPYQRTDYVTITVRDGQTNKVEMKLAPPKILSGIFVDLETNQPVASVRVSPQSYYTTSFSENQELIMTPVETERTEFVTGPDGRFTLSVAPASQSFGVVLPESYLAAGENMSFGWCYARTDPGNLRYTLSRATKIPIRVFARESKTPIAGASVAVFSGAKMGQAPFSLTTDSDGWCEGVVAIGVPCTITVRAAEGYAYVNDKKPVTENPEEVEVILQAFGSIAGAVTLDGRPFSGITVVASIYPMGQVPAVTDAQGHYLLSNVPPGPIYLGCQGYQPYADREPPSTISRLNPGENRENINIDFESRSAFAGTPKTPA